MLQLLRLLSTSTEPLSYTAIRSAIAPLPVDLERARAEKLVWAGDYLPSTYIITEAGRTRLAELEAEERVIERSSTGTISGLRLATSEALANSATVEGARTAGVYVEVSDDSPLEEVRALLSRVSDLEGDCGMLREDLEEANKELAAQKARNEAMEEQLRAAEAEAAAHRAHPSYRVAGGSIDDNGQIMLILRPKPSVPTRIEVPIGGWVRVIPD
jgi:hypothetical protein